MSKTFTYIAPSANICTLTLAGIRGRVAAVNGAWDAPPSPYDTRSMKEWFQRNYGAEYGTVFAVRIDDADQRELAIDHFLQGGRPK